jgi:DNA-binding MarR family transcriptional regulator
MGDDSQARPAPAPHLIKGDEGGPLSRRLIMVRLARLMDFVARASALQFTRTSGLSDFEWRVLARVCETPDLSLNELAGHVHRNLAQVSRTVKRLVGMGLLKSKGRGGGPGVVISPAPLGSTVYGPLVALAVETDAELTRGLGEEDLERLKHCIEVMTQNALARLAREQQAQEPDGP